MIISYVGVIIGAASAIFIQPSFLSSTELGFTRNLYNFSFLLSIAVPLGLPNIILRFYPQHKDQQDVKHYFFGFILSYLAIAAGLLLVVFTLFRPFLLDLYGSDSQLFVTYFTWVTPYSLIIALNTSITCYSQAVYKSTVPSFLNDVVSRLLVICITVLYYYRLIGFELYVVGFVSIYLLVSLILIMYLRRFGLVSFRIKNLLATLPLRHIVPYGLLMCLISFASFGLKSVDAIFLGMYSLSDVAVYSTAVFLALFIEVPLGAIERISHPRIAENFTRGNHHETGKIYAESVRYLLASGGYIFLGVCACSPFIFELLPPEYSRSAWLVQVLALGSLVNVATGVNNAILFYTNHFRTGALLLTAAFLLMLICDVLLIPRYGMVAAAWITTSVSMLYNLAKFIMIRRLFGFQPYDLNALKLAGLIAVGFGFTLILPHWPLHPIVHLFINGAAITLFYIAGVYRLKVVPELFTLTRNTLRKKG